MAQPQETPVAASGVSVPVETVSVAEETPTNTPTANEKDRRNYVTHCRNRLFTTSTR